MSDSKTSTPEKCGCRITVVTHVLANGQCDFLVSLERCTMHQAAPELLAAARGLLATLEGWTPGVKSHSIGSDKINSLRAAVAASTK